MDDARAQLARAAKLRRASARADALISVARRISSLPNAERETFARAAGLELAGIVEKLSDSTTAADRRAAAACIVLRPHALLLPRLASLIRDAAQEVRAETDLALANIARALLHAPQLAADDTLQTAFDRLLADAARDYPEHRSQAVIDAVLLHARCPGPALREVLADASQPAHLLLRAALRKAEDPEVFASAFALLSNASLSPAAAQALANLPATSDPSAALELWPLLAHPARSRRLRAAISRTNAEPASLAAERVAGLPEPARLGAIRWLQETVRSEARLTSLLADFLADPSARVRMAAVHALAPAARSRDANALLRDFSFDADPRVARHAAIALSAPRTPVPATWAADQARSPHAALRAVSARLLDAVDDPLRSPVAARRALARDHATTIDALRCEIAQGERRLAAINAVRRLGLARLTELELLAAAADPADHRVVASAAGALADAASPSALHAVSRLVGHPDARVRANAIESVARLDPASPLIESKLLDPHPRTRANAILAALRDPPQRTRAVEALLASLADDRAPIRISALWAAEHAAPGEAANHVAALAAESASGHERMRARRAARRLLASMREAPRLRLTG